MDWSSISRSWLHAMNSSWAQVSRPAITGIESVAQAAHSLQAILCRRPGALRSSVAKQRELAHGACGRNASMSGRRIGATNGKPRTPTSWPTSTTGKEPIRLPPIRASRSRSGGGGIRKRRADPDPAEPQQFSGHLRGQSRPHLLMRPRHGAGRVGCAAGAARAAATGQVKESLPPQVSPGELASNGAGIQQAVSRPPAAGRRACFLRGEDGL